METRLLFLALMFFLIYLLFTQKGKRLLDIYLGFELRNNKEPKEGKRFSGDVLDPKGVA